ncbi:MAG: DUF4395 domain-containing protein [Campylobacterota bacterium]|nr:DUF4395 domain-containing protein [Campylobacterota bacterium]
MSPSCPISGRRIDSNVVRSISVGIALTAILLLLTHQFVFAFILLADFTFRVLRLNQYSPFCTTASFILNSIHATPRMGDEAPKRFALYLGWGMSILITLFFLFGLDLAAEVLVWVLLSCALMEAIFEFCVGCTLYHYLKIFRIIRS